MRKRNAQAGATGSKLGHFAFKINDTESTHAGQGTRTKSDEKKTKRGKIDARPRTGAIFRNEDLFLNKNPTKKQMNLQFANPEDNQKSSKTMEK